MKVVSNDALIEEAFEELISFLKEEIEADKSKTVKEALGRLLKVIGIYLYELPYHAYIWFVFHVTMKIREKEKADKGKI